jgi:hypothetical protein
MGEFSFPQVVCLCPAWGGSWLLVVVGAFRVRFLALSVANPRRILGLQNQVIGATVKASKQVFKLIPLLHERQLECPMAKILEREMRRNTPKRRTQANHIISEE